MSNFVLVLIIVKNNNEWRCAVNNEMYVPEYPRKKCTGFSYIGPKLYNMIPKGKEHKRSEDNGWLQNTNKGMDMEENPLILIMSKRN